MDVTTRVAGEGDLPFLVEVDRHVTAGTLSDVVASGRVRVAEVDGEPAGLLRRGLFWQLAAGHPSALTSTMSAETSQHFFRRLGYVDAGSLLLPGEPLEIVLREELDLT
jgi:hypothetical protein